MNTKEIILLGGTGVYVDFSKRPVKCRSCNAEIRFGLTDNNKFIPIEEVEEGVYQSHFASCPDATKFRRKTMSRERQCDEIARNEQELSKL
ncbi:hypothetical protein KAR28_04275 [Candidatus Parcubacteria bacterium]|nr:hypothetical protein [Candidatus Parcubacteria bacterium]